MYGVSKEKASEFEPQAADDIVRSGLSQRTCDFGHVRPNQVRSGAVHLPFGDVRRIHQIRCRGSTTFIGGGGDSASILGSLV